jgi:hypothetical protein
MKSLANRRFWDSYRKLPEAVRRDARKSYRYWIANPRLPLLHFKKVGKVWSIRIGNTNYRALADVQGDTAYWFWIGPHDEDERIISGR